MATLRSDPVLAVVCTVKRREYYLPFLVFTSPVNSKRINLKGSESELTLYLSGKPIGEENHNLAVDQAPIASRYRPFFGDFLNGKINHFFDGVVGGENRLGFSEFANHSMVGFDRVCRINHTPDLFGVVEERSKVSPVVVP